MKHLLYLLLAGSLLTEQPLYGTPKKNKKMKKKGKKRSAKTSASAVATPTPGTPTQITKIDDVKDIATIKKNTENKIDALISKTRKQLLKDKDNEATINTLFDTIKPAQDIISDSKKGIYPNTIKLSRSLSELTDKFIDPKNKEIYNSFKIEFLNILNEYNLNIIAEEEEAQKKITENWKDEFSSIDANMFANNKDEVAIAFKKINNGVDLKKFFILVINKALNIDLNKEQNLTKEQTTKAINALENCLIRNYDKQQKMRTILDSNFNNIIRNILNKLYEKKTGMKSSEMRNIVMQNISDQLSKNDIFLPSKAIEKKNIKEEKKKKAKELEKKTKKETNPTKELNESKSKEVEDRKKNGIIKKVNTTTNNKKEEKTKASEKKNINLLEDDNVTKETKKTDRSYEKMFEAIKFTVEDEKK